jgi:hypothetical protein
MVMTPSPEPSRKRTRGARAGAIASIRRALVSIAFWWHVWLKPHKSAYRPGWTMGKLEPGAKRAPPAPRSISYTRELCDACHLAEAKFRIIVPKADLHFCGHHFHKHRMHIAMHGYEVKEL